MCSSFQQIQAMTTWAISLTACLLFSIFIGVTFLTESVKCFSKFKDLETRAFTNPPKPSYTLTYCSFEDDVCGYHLYQDYKYNQNGLERLKYEDYFSRPKTDRTLGVIGRGSFIGKRTVNDNADAKAVAESPYIAPADNYCVKFWFTTFSQNTKSLVTLRVNAKVDGGTGYPVTWYRSTESQDWYLAEVEFDEEYTSNGFSIQFEFPSYHSLSRFNKIHTNAFVDDVYAYNTRCADVAKFPKTKYIHKGSNYTSYYTFHTGAENWTEAASFCREQGPMSFLVSVETADEQAYLAKTIQNNPVLNSLGKKGFYTSGNDLKTERTFRWSGTLTNEYVRLYTNWRDGQPNNVGGVQNCLILQYWRENYKWGDRKCTLNLPFICEVKDSKKDSEFIRKGQHVSHLG